MYFTHNTVGRLFFPLPHRVFLCFSSRMAEEMKKDKWGRGKTKGGIFLPSFPPLFILSSLEITSNKPEDARKTLTVERFTVTFDLDLVRLALTLTLVRPVGGHLQILGCSATSTHLESRVKIKMELKSKKKSIYGRCMKNYEIQGDHVGLGLGLGWYCISRSPGRSTLETTLITL